ncbi:Type 1 glutamine amidotransferase-like domain-containing protein [Candidatus Saccharibacteria bacterium]|nr:Type 1 glutamine amidotransferase-like domain-containing protein [Candidatus Saccharibacteria bacterium]
MRLFLASSELGNYPKTLRRLAGGNRRVLIIRNARDYRPEDYVAGILGDKTALFLQYGFDPQVLDLRQFFGRKEELEEYLDQYDPGIIYCLGGNPFILNAALHLSGMDKIIRSALLSDAIVYAGESAGIMVATKDLTPYIREGHEPQDSKALYKKEAPTEGLGLIDFYPIPHVNRGEHRDRTDYYIRRIESIRKRPVLMNDSDVYVVDGRKAELLRG